VAVLQLRHASDGLLRLEASHVNLGQAPEPIWLRRADSGILVVTDAPTRKQEQAGARRAAIVEILQRNPVGLTEPEIVEALAADAITTNRKSVHRDLKDHLHPSGQVVLVESGRGRAGAVWTSSTSGPDQSELPS
jgi:hypothetical protein